LDCFALEVETDNLSLEEFTDRLSRNVRNQLPTYDAQLPSTQRKS
jgi:hypothetical protein